MNTTYYRLELRRLRRDAATMFFTAGLPAFLYIIFGASPEYGSEPIRDGNVAMFIMIAMAAYGAVTATTGIGGSVAIERMQGWTRQLGLTPMSDRDYITVKAAVAATIAAVPILLIFALGAVTGAEAPVSVWIISGLVLLLGSVAFALYGLNFGLAFRSEAAVSAAGGSLVIMSFLGNIFVPLSGWQLAVAKFTPLFGYVSLARHALTGGGTLDIESGEIIDIPLWQTLTNVAVWTTVFAVVALYLVKRSRTRQ